MLFLYKAVLAIEIGAVPSVVRARTPARLPVVVSREEIAAILKQLTGTMRLIVMLLYGTGVRIEECVDLRVKDLDFDRHHGLYKFLLLFWSHVGQETIVMKVV